MAGNWQFRGAVLALGLSLNLAYSDAPAGPPVVRLGLLKPIGELVGKKVADAKEHGLGRTEDVLLDLTKGQVVAVLVSAKGNVRLLVPARTVSYVDKSTLVLRTDRKLFEGAPRLTGAGLGQEALNPAFAYFGQPTPALAAGLSSAAALLNRRVVSRNNECVGQLKEVMVDLPAGAVAYIVIEPAGDLTTSDQLYVVPPTVVEVTAPGQPLMLKTDRAHFLAGPGFSKQFWTDLSFPEMAAKVRAHYAQTPQPAAQQAGATPQPTSSARSDSQLAEAVMAEIFNEAKGTLKLNVFVSTRHGKVTLKGSVKDEKQKARVVAAAERVAGAQNVENLLETDRKNTTAKL